MKNANIINRFKIIKFKPSMPWEAIYLYWFGFILKNRQEIYKNNVICKLLEVPRKFKYAKDLIFQI